MNKDPLLLPRQLPDLPGGNVYQKVVSNAYDAVKNDYERYAALLYQDDCDPIRLKIYFGNLLTQTIPLFIALLQGGAGIDENWAIGPLELLYVLASTLTTLSELMSQR